MPATEGKIYCPKCGARSPADARFCYKCGAKLPRLSELAESAGAFDESLERPGAKPPPTPARAEPEPDVLERKKLPPSLLGVSPDDRPEVQAREDERVKPLRPAQPAQTKPMKAVPSAEVAPAPSGIEDEADEKFLRGYSFGPGCGLYLLNRIFWPLAAAMLVLNLLGRGLEMVAEEPYRYGIIGHGVAVVFLDALRVLFLLASLAFIGLLIWVGTVARRKRWERLKWKSFSHFRSDERIWNVLGIIGWVLGAIWFLAALVGGLR